MPRATSTTTTEPHEYTVNYFHLDDSNCLNLKLFSFSENTSSAWAYGCPTYPSIKITAIAASDPTTFNLLAFFLVDNGVGFDTGMVRTEINHNGVADWSLDTTFGTKITPTSNP